MLFCRIDERRLRALGSGLESRIQVHVTSPRPSEPIGSRFASSSRSHRLRFLHFHPLPSDRRLSSNRTYRIAQLVGRLAHRFALRRQPHMARVAHSLSQVGSGFHRQFRRTCAVYTMISVRFLSPLHLDFALHSQIIIFAIIALALDVVVLPTTVWFIFIERRSSLRRRAACRRQRHTRSSLLFLVLAHFRS